jgi:quinol monooxygenase YgiN
MIAVIATMFIKPGMAEEFVLAFAQRRARVLATEPDALQYELYASPEQPLQFLAIERFATRASYQAHIAGSRDHQRMMACFARPPTAQLLDAVPGCAGGFDGGA